MTPSGIRYQAPPVASALASLPQTWEVQRIKSIATINAKSLPDDTDPEVVFSYVDIGSVDSRGRVNQTNDLSFADSPSRARRLVKSGDVIVSTVRTYLKSIAYISMDTEHLVVSTGFATLSPGNRVAPRYLYWWLRGSPFVEEIMARSVGVSYPAVNATDVGDVAIPLPPLKAQERIAAFLDAETARIDELIDEQEQMQLLLREGMRSRAVELLLMGLDPITGLGLLKTGWALARLGDVLTLQRGYDLPTDQRSAGDVPVISSGGISGFHDMAAENPPGVVTGRYGTVGEVFYSEVPYWPLNTSLFVSDFKGNDPRWCYHLLKRLPLDVDSAKSAVTGINRNVIHRLYVPRPSLEEQRELVDHLDKRELQHKEIDDEITRQIQLLQEHRQALITAAVTGLSEPVVW